MSIITQQLRTTVLRYSSPRPWLIAIGISLAMWACIIWGTYWLIWG